MTLLSHWGRAIPIIEDGKLIAMRPAADDPDPSRISENVIDTVAGNMRIGQPMVRRGYLAGEGSALRGEDSFVAVSWDEATGLVADRLEQIIEQHGNKAIFGGSYGWASAGRFNHAQSQVHRFLNVCGGYVRSVNTHSYAAAEVTLPHVIGNQEGLSEGHTPWELIAGHTELFVAFGGLPIRNAQVTSGGAMRHRVREWLLSAKSSGTAFVNIGPLRDDVDAGLDSEWIAPRPNTDVAMMLGMAHVIEVEGLLDRDFLAKYTTGYDRFRDYLLGTADGSAKTPEWAAEICGIDAEIMRKLARRMAAHRTMISMSLALQRADHGEQAVWMTITLAAMLGQIGLPGGGYGVGYAAANQVGNISLPFSWAALSQFHNPVKDFIPVARLAEMLERPGERFDYNGGTYTYPDIELIWWAGGNPFHHQPDLNRLHRAWKKPQLVIVQEPLWNANAKHADIVLPCTMPIERNDIGMTRSEPHLIAMKQLLKPFGDARNDFDILSMIAARLGKESSFTEGRSEMEWIKHLYDRSAETAARHGHNLPDFEEFWDTGEFRFERLPPPKAQLGDFRADPSAYPRKTPSGKIEIYSSTVAGFGYADCPGMPTWMEPAEWLGNAPPDALHLISNQPSRKLHSQLDNGSYSRDAKVAGREPARIHPTEADKRGLQTGDIVRVNSARGACLAGLVISDDVAPGCIQMSTGAWLDVGEDGLDRHGNVNILTLDKPTSKLAQGSTAHTTVVFVAKFIGEAPAMMAFEPPTIA